MRFVLLGGYLGLVVAVETAEVIFGSGAGQVVVFFGSIPYGLLFWFGMFPIWFLRG